MKTSQVSAFPTPVTTTANGVVIVAEFLVYASAQITIAGTAPVGTLTFEASNDIITKGGTAPTNWSTIATVNITDVGTFLLPKTDLCYQYIRVVFTLASGTATSVIVNIKTIGV